MNEDTPTQEATVPGGFGQGFAGGTNEPIFPVTDSAPIPGGFGQVVHQPEAEAPQEAPEADSSPSV